MVFGEKRIYFLCSQKIASLLDAVTKTAQGVVGADIVMHVKSKSEDGTTQMDAIFNSIRTQMKSPVVGYIAKEAPEGKLLETWDDKLKKSGLQLGDITHGISDILALKDHNEITCVRDAASLAATTLKLFVVPELETVINEERRVTHSSLANKTEKTMLQPHKLKLKLNPKNIDICYPPIFQSGGKFDLRPSAISDDETLYYDSASIIICAVRSQYNNYCSNVARTFLINSTSMQNKAYGVLLKAQEAAIAALKPGNKINVVYQAALAVVQKDAPELVRNLTKSAGTGIGLEFRESGLLLNAKNDKLLKEGMVFNVSLGFQNLQAVTSNPKSRNFSLLLADTVIVTRESPEVATRLISKALKDVEFLFNKDEEEEKHEFKANSIGKEALRSKATLRSDNQEISKEELRRQHQAELARQKIVETSRRLAGEGATSGDNRSAVRASSELVAYKNVNDLPPPPKDMMIQVDQKNEALLLPVYGSMVPFHVSTVKTVTSQSDTNHNSYIRIIFIVPGMPFAPTDVSSVSKNQSAIYLKEVSYRSKDSRRISEVVQRIKTLRQNVVQRQSEKAERATLVTQEKLVLAGNRFKPVRLSDLWIRASFGGRGRKLPGTLEAHVNGFRYSTSKDVHIDIMYVNVKHAFFQPAEKEMITLLHFHLHNHIMVGTKKTKDVQFYVEVMDIVQTIGGGRRSAYDPDEIEEEQRERDRKNKINMGFQNFVNRVNDIWSQPQFKGLDLEFDQPLRELGFHGVPYKSSAFIVPTSSCLVELIETPFLVITLGEIEIVNLERAGFGQKNFDMAIVFKDFKCDVMRIDSIPISSLDGIKEWLDTTNTKYYESKLNLNWRLILKTIVDDPQKFIDDGGWEFLNLEGRDSETDNTEESDGEFEPTDDEPESDSEDDESESESMVESEEDEEEESEEEKGKTWEELETEASHADREKGDESDSEDERRRRKNTFSKSRGAGPSSSAAPPSKRPKFR
ncbi:unnamed protein product [Cuscuta campestris]|uniref:FACT complex subunit n=1 Tax=Cuscuta campestris TaxID=132261 RepID=A0A484NET3_9ASTE|nr:unnamed protein product [Cuscuta campestris]